MKRLLTQILIATALSAIGFLLYLTYKERMQTSTTSSSTTASTTTSTTRAATSTTTTKAASTTSTSFIPTGTITMFAASSAPSGWLTCEGQAVSRVDYYNLFNTIGTLYGAGDGTNTFNLPDLRGSFVRGYDNGRGIDKGRVFATTQPDAMQVIRGTVAVGNGFNDTKCAVEYADGAFVKGTTYGSSAATKSTIANVASDIYFDSSRVARTASETRPQNIAMFYLIKT